MKGSIDGKKAMIKNKYKDLMNDHDLMNMDPTSLNSLQKYLKLEVERAARSKKKKFDTKQRRQKTMKNLFELKTRAAKELLKFQAEYSADPRRKQPAFNRRDNHELFERKQALKRKYTILRKETVLKSKDDKLTEVRKAGQRPRNVNKSLDSSQLGDQEKSKGMLSPSARMQYLRRKQMEVERQKDIQYKRMIALVSKSKQKRAGAKASSLAKSQAKQGQGPVALNDEAVRRSDGSRQPPSPLRRSLASSSLIREQGPPRGS